MQIQQIVRFHELIKHIYYATLQLFYVIKSNQNQIKYDFNNG